MKILSVFSLLVATNADFKASPVCIAGTTCVGFGVTLTGVLAAQEAFHSNHKVPKSASDSKGGPELGAFWDDDLKVGASCGGVRRLDSDGVHRRLACATGSSCTHGKCAENVGEGGACGDSANNVNCGSDLWCSENKYKLANIKTKHGDATRQNRCQKSFWKSSIFADSVIAVMVIAEAVTVIATGGAAAVAEGAIEAGADAVGDLSVDATEDGVVDDGVSNTAVDGSENEIAGSTDTEASDRSVESADSIVELNQMSPLLPSS